MPLYITVRLSPAIMGSIEPENVIQNLDSLWFFSNALLSTNPLKSPLSIGKQINNNNNNNQNSDDDTIPILESTKSPTCPSPSYTTSSLRKTSPNKADAFDVDDRALRMKEEGPEGERSSKLKRRAKKCYSLHRRMIGCSNFEGRVGFGYDGVVEMSSSHNDGEAMKRQLRTWAVAVAYTAVHDTNNSSMMVACS